MSFSFGSGQQTTQASSGFTFGQPQQQQSTGFTFGTNATTTSSGFSFGNTPASQPSSGFSFGNPTSTAFSLGSNPTSGGFSFGSSNPTSGGFSFGSSNPSSGGSTGFSFGTGATPGNTGAASGFFGLGTSNASGTGGVAGVPASGASTFTFGSNPATSGAQPTFGTSLSQTTSSGGGGFSFGTNTTTTSSTASLGTTAVTSASVGLPLSTPSGGFSFGFPTTTTSGGLSFGTTSTTTASGGIFGGTSGITFGATPSQIGTTTVGTTVTTTTKPTGLTFRIPLSSGPAPSVTTSAAPVLQFGVTGKATGTTASSTSGFGSIQTSSSGVTVQPATTSVTKTTGFSFGAVPLLLSSTSTTTTSTSDGFNIVVSKPSSTVTSASGFSSLLTATTSTSVGSAVPTATPVTTMNFRQLEESINKWTLELEELERTFLNQATQVNAWDRLLISNGQKITSLNEAVEKVKLDQQRLDHELDFIVAQQRELEELLVPLEKSVESSPHLSVQQHADLEREHTYHLAENIDGQLKRMAEDIKEIIERLNTSNKSQEDVDPMQQISKILSVHMDALQWIEQNSGIVQRKIEEIGKISEMERRDQDKSFRM